MKIDIETKFNMGQEVWYVFYTIKDKTILRGEIAGINIYYRSSSYDVYYLLDRNYKTEHEEFSLYASKEDCQKVHKNALS